MLAIRVLNFGVFSAAMLAAVVFALPSHALKFELASADGVPYINATGRVDEKDADRLSFFLLRHATKELKRVALDSDGGSLSGGMQLGQILRNQNMEVFVEAGKQCLSACFFAFIGGSKRNLLGDGRIGVHQFRFIDSVDDTASTAQEVAAGLVSYTSEMGINLGVFEKAFATAPEDMHIFSNSELFDYNIAFWRQSMDIDTEDACPFPGITHRWDCEGKSYLLTEPKPPPIGCVLRVYRLRDGLGLYPNCGIPRE